MAARDISTIKRKSKLFQLSHTKKQVKVSHDDVIKWKHFPRYWPFVRGIHRLPVNSPHKGQWHGALMFSLICVWINGWVNNREAGDSRRNRAHYDVIAMKNGPATGPIMVPIIGPIPASFCPVMAWWPITWRVAGDILDTSIKLMSPFSSEWYRSHLFFKHDAWLPN